MPNPATAATSGPSPNTQNDHSVATTYLVRNAKF
jgi:hypothetical protein